MKDETFIFSSESVSEGHPDKVADKISDAILDEYLKLDPEAHVACETLVAPDLVVNAGEISCKAASVEVDTEAVARKVAAGIGYDRDGEGFNCSTFTYLNHLHGQSADIARGVDRESKEEQGAGDQGMMFGYATNETPEFMPAAVVYSHSLLKYFAEMRRSGQVNWLRPDAKSQISIVYCNGKPLKIDTVVLSHQTTEEGATESNYQFLADAARGFLEKTGLVSASTRFLVNPTGKFVIGGPCGDSGLTGRKIIVDTYGGAAAHGGGAFSGKDPSKVDRSAAYYTRYAAKNIVAAGLADKCQIQVAYAIGVAKPVSICVSTFNTAKAGVSDARLAEILSSGKIFDFRPYALIEDLGLKTPKGWCYADTSAYGHFGRNNFPWEKTDRIDALISACG